MKKKVEIEFNLMRKDGNIDLSHERLQKILRLEAQKEYDQALQLAQTELANCQILADRQVLSEEEISLIMLLFRIFHRKADVSNVLKLGEDALPSLQNSNTASAVEALKYISYAYYRQGEYQKCLNALEQAEKMLDDLDGFEKQKQYLDLQGRKAMTFRFVNNCAEAVRLCEQALQTVENPQETDSAVLAELYRIFGWSLLAQSRTNSKQAKEALQHALSLMQSSQYNGTQGQRGEIYYTCGTAAYQMREYAEAAEFLQKALSCMEKEYGLQSVELCNSLNQLGAVLSKQNQTDQAAEYHLRSYLIRKNAYGDDNLLTSISFENWLNEASATQSKSGSEEAVPASNDWDSQYGKLIQIRSRLYYQKPESCAFWLAQADSSYALWLLEQADLAQQEEKVSHLFEEAQKLYQEGKRKDCYSISLKNHGTLYLRLNQPEKALVYFQNALPLIQSVFGIKHPASVQTQSLIEQAEEMIKQ